MRRFAVVGAGWAGLSAAVQLVREGHNVTVYEAARHAGGRARRVDWQTGDGRLLALDNGQHILLGAYRATLELIETLGISPEAVFHRLPLRLQGGGRSPEFRMRAPRLPAPFHLFAALFAARGLGWSDRFAAAALLGSARRRGWRLPADCRVAEWLEANGQPARLRKYLWEPLCAAALNTPPEIASAQLFLNVLRDSVGSPTRVDSDLLLPKVDLGALLAEPALAFIAGHGTAHLGRRVTSLQPAEHGIEVFLDHNRRSRDVPGFPHSTFDGVVLAVSAEHVPAALAEAEDARPEFGDLIRQCAELSWQPIVTVYLLYAQTPFRASGPPMLMLDHNPAAGDFGQWIFDRERLSAGREMEGLVAVVISANGPHRQLNTADLVAAVTAQVGRQLGANEPPFTSKVIVEKHATFSAIPGVHRPGNRTPDPRIVLGGDYTATDDPAEDYPATLESAVRSGRRAAALLSGA